MTKIKIGSEIVTMMDRITFHHENNTQAIIKEETPKMPPQTIHKLKHSPFRKEVLNPSVKKLLKKFEVWIRENEP